MECFLYTAHELRDMMLFEVPSIFERISRQKYDHIMLLVEAFHILTSSDISEAQVTAAHDRIERFYREFPDVYGMCVLHTV